MSRLRHVALAVLALAALLGILGMHALSLHCLPGASQEAMHQGHPASAAAPAPHGPEHDATRYAAAHDGSAGHSSPTETAVLTAGGSAGSSDSEAGHAVLACLWLLATVAAAALAARPGLRVRPPGRPRLRDQKLITGLGRIRPALTLTELVISRT